jgi:hypothetical protein
MELLLARTDDGINIEFILLQVVEALSLYPPFPSTRRYRCIHQRSPFYFVSSTHARRSIFIVLSPIVGGLLPVLYVSTWLYRVL